MHVPDGFIDVPTSLAAAGVATAGVALALRRAARDDGDGVDRTASDRTASGRTPSDDPPGDDGLAPLTGLVAAFVFAAQMVNFPVAGGTSGHLIGGLLAAVLLGPWSAVLALTVVVGLQALLFADGGVSALGINIVDLALVPALAGTVLFRAGRRLLPANRTGVLVAAAGAAWASVVLSALTLTGIYALGGNGAASLATVAGAMVGVHTVIGLGEAAITVLVLGPILASRPDLVHGARDLAPQVPPIRAEPAL